MDKKQAQEKLGLKAEHYTPEDVKSAYTKLKHELEEKLKGAPTEGLRQKYEARLQEIEEARNILLSSNKTAISSNLSRTMLHDLPDDRPSYTGLGQTSIGEQLDPSVTLSIGRVLVGRYEILGLLDVGGMGAVYSAHDRIKDEEIAIKVLLPRLLEKEGARQRFLNEAKIAASLSHPGILNVFDIQNEGDLYFITMEKLEGCSLRAAMKERKAPGKQWEVKEVCDIGYQLCEALAFAHDSTIHRDIKPENIWLCNNNRVKIMDFGIARLMSGEQLTSTSVAMGSAYYMAPEQIHNTKNIDHRADQYPIGVVLYELLTGQVPSGRFKAPKKLRRDIPSGLSNSILRALESKPGDRFPGIAALGNRLKNYRSGFFAKLHRIALPIVILAVLILSFPIWKPPVTSLIRGIFFSIPQELIISVKEELSDLERISVIIKEQSKEKIKDKQETVRRFQILMEKARSMEEKEDYRDLDKLLKEQMKLTLSELDELLESLAYISSERGNNFRKQIEELPKDVEKSWQQAKSKVENLENQKVRISKRATPDEIKNLKSSLAKQRRLEAINSDLFRIFKTLVVSDSKFEADGMYKRGNDALREKQYVEAIIYLEEAENKYNDLISRVEPAKAFVANRYDLKLSEVLKTYKRKYPFVQETFYRKFNQRDETAANTLSNGQTENAYNQFNALKSDLKKAEDLAKRYIKDKKSLKALNVPKDFAKRYNQVSKQLNGALDQIAQHDFKKASGTFDSVESARLKLIDDIIRKELTKLDTKIKKSEIYPAFVSLNNFDITWGAYINNNRYKKYKERRRQLWDKVKNPVISLGGEVYLKLVYIRGGTFNMGSPSSEYGREEDEGPCHAVKLDGFWIGKYEITQEQYETIMHSNPSRFKKNQNPVEGVSWYNARKFCENLSKITGKRFRLPMEAEWEYACRAGTNTPYYWEKQWTSSKCLAENRKNSPASVGTFPPNPWGLYDMSGNVWEWCGDWYDMGYYAIAPQNNPKGPASGSIRVFRGGSFSNPSHTCRSANRDFGSPDYRAPNLGFRVVFSPFRK